MNPESMAGCISDLSRAFDPAKSPQGHEFWDLAIRRLSDHLHAHLYRHKRAVALHRKDYGATADSRESATIAFRPQVNRRLAACAANQLSVNLGYLLPYEGEGYWYGIYNFLVLAGDPYALGAAIGHPPDRLTAVSWQDELTILTNYGLQPPPFRLCPWYIPGTFAHHDKKDPTLLRFRPKNRPLDLSKFILCKPGKFLALHYGGGYLSGPQIAELAAEFRVAAVPPTMQLARSPKEIDFAYRHGPESCMSGDKEVDGIKAVTAYAGPDLAIAYLLKRGMPSLVAARALVWPERKVYSRLYGDSVALKTALQAEGYRCAYSNPDQKDLDAFHGARLAAIHAKGKIPADAKLEAKGEPVLILPYGDQLKRATYDREHDHVILQKNTGTHCLAGGYSIPAIDAGKPLPLRACSSGRFQLEYQVGYQGGNQTNYEYATHFNREPPTPHTKTPISGPTPARFA